MTKIAIQGVHGCFHEQAARLFYGNEIDVCECLNFEDLFTNLNAGQADGAIMAIENTVAGGLLPNYSLLRKYGRKIKGEVFIRIREEKQSYAQVAEELGISMNTVDAQLQKAITRLKEMINRAEID